MSRLVPPPAQPPQPTTVLVTGATGGIRFFTARALAPHAAHLLITGRSSDRGDAAARDLQGAAPDALIEFLAVDHSTVAANHQLAAAVQDRLERLDVLVNNVGGLYPERHETPDGYEATLAVSFLAPVALTHALQPLLAASGRARVVNVVSSAFAMWKRDPFADIQARARYVGIGAYAHAKLLNLLWTLALARRLADDAVTVNATNPGTAWTHLTQSLTPRAVPAWRPIWPLVRFFQRRASPQAAARAPTFVATSHDLAAVTGAYYDEKCRRRVLPAQLRDPTVQDRALAVGEDLAAHARA